MLGLTSSPEGDYYDGVKVHLKKIRQNIEKGGHYTVSQANVLADDGSESSVRYGFLV